MKHNMYVNVDNVTIRTSIFLTSLRERVDKLICTLVYAIFLTFVLL